MDPLSLSVSCYTLITAVAALSTQVSSFIRSVRSARSDVDALTQELASLRMVLEVLVDDSTDGSNIPEPIEKQLLGVLANCNQVVSQIETALSKYASDGMVAAAKWATTGRDKVENLRTHLGAHKSTLKLALEIVDLSMSRSIKNDTQELRTDTSELKQDTALLKQSSAVIVENTTQILEGLGRIRTQIPLADSELGTNGYALQNYLDSLTVYTTEVYEASVADLEETLSDDTIQEEQPSPKYSSREHASSNSITEKTAELSIDVPGDGLRGEDNRALNETKESAEPKPRIESVEEPQPKDLGTQSLEEDSADLLKTLKASSQQPKNGSVRHIEDTETANNIEEHSLSMIGRFNQTIAEYTRAIETDPGNQIYSSNRKAALALMEDLRKALREDSGTQKPIKFKDAVGRKFSFPWRLACSWDGMEDLIRAAFLHVDVVGPHVAEGHYDLVGPDNEIILPALWETVIKPDCEITMQMWPMPEPKPESEPEPEADAKSQTVQVPKTPPVPAVKAKKKTSQGSFFFGPQRTKPAKRRGMYG